MPRSFIRLGVIVGSAVLVFAGVNSFAGDPGHAQRTLDSIERFLADKTPDGLRHAADMIDDVATDLQGVDEAIKAPLQKRLDEDRKRIEAGLFLRDKGEFATRLDLAMGNARQLVSPQGAAVRAEFAATPADLDRAEKLLASPEAARFVDADARKKLADELAGIHRKLDEKAAMQDIERVQGRLQSLESQLPEFLNHAREAEQNNAPEQIDSEVNALATQVGMMSRQLKALPDSLPEAKKMRERLAAVTNQFETTVVRVDGKQVYLQPKGDWDVFEPQTAGWKLDRFGVTLAQFTGEPSEKAAALNSPKAVMVVTAANGWLSKNFGSAYDGATKEDGAYHAFLRDEKIKGLFLDVTGQRDEAEAKLLGFAAALVDEAEKTKLTPEAQGRFKTLIEQTLPASLGESAKFKPVLDRIKAMLPRDQK